ncbi:hypothetical protein C6496_08020 [Candidatus Poribacteria bacterium]|nr:MAG: hypothetical protein C6496_08020 [Candidatus Poribacteria bacterium]
MPLWGTILTVIFSGIVALGTVINFFRSATKDDIKKVRNELKEVERRLEQKIDNINQRIDWHLEGHS